MRSPVVLAVLLAAFTAEVAMPAVAAADVPSKLAAKPTAILGDELELALPAGMKLEARGHDIMSADESPADETRAVLDAGPARFVMMAYELYATSGADFKAQAQADATQQAPGITVDALAVAKPLTAVGGALAVTATTDANLVYAVWIANADAMVQLVMFYVNPEGAKQGAAWVALAKKIALTATAGKHALATKAGDRVIGGWRVTVPEGWVSSAQPGPDFIVYHLRKLAVLGAVAPSCGVYVGGYASFQYVQAGVDKANVKKVRGKLLGAPVEWAVWSVGNHATTETMAPSPDGETVHVFCNASTEGELGGLRTLAETMRAK